MLDAREARQMLAAAATSSPSSTACFPEGTVDYLISCQYDGASRRLLLAAGTSHGTAALFPVAEPPAGAGGDAPPPAHGPTGPFGAPVALLPAGAHNSVRGRN